MNIPRFVLTLALVASITALTHSGAFAQGVQLFAILNGGNEVSAGGQAAAGDPDGFGAASVIIRGPDAICFSILVSGIDAPTGAHIHRGNAGTNGPVVIPLAAPNAGNPGRSAGCVRGLSSALVQRIRNNPGGFYVNVHTGQFPEGAVRGQLF